MGAGVTGAQVDCRFVMPSGVIMPSSVQENGSEVLVNFGGSGPEDERALKPEYGLSPSGRDLMFSALLEALLESQGQKTVVWGGTGVRCHQSARFFKSLGGGIIVDASPVANLVLEKMTESGGRGSFPPNMGGFGEGTWRIMHDGVRFVDWGSLDRSPGTTRLVAARPGKSDAMLAWPQRPLGTMRPRCRQLSLDSHPDLLSLERRTGAMGERERSGATRLMPGCAMLDGAHGESAAGMGKTER